MWGTSGLTNRPATTKARGIGEEVRGRLSGHGFSTEGREERRRMRSEFPRWGNERADEPYTARLNGVKNLSGSADIPKLSKMSITRKETLTFLLKNLPCPRLCVI
jgi:hypothetical protein